MEELTFEIIYENLQKKLNSITNEELLKENQVIDKILELDSEYRECREKKFTTYVQYIDLNNI